MSTSGTRDIFTSAARSFAELAGKIPAGSWDGPGLGDWTVRDLVGHTSRSLVTVSTYLKSPADHEDVTDAVDYYIKIRDFMAGAGAAAIVERGRQAGRDLGADPVDTIDRLLTQTLADITAIPVTEDPLIEVIGGLGLRLSSYLPTRTFELAVHGIDIARAVGVEHAPPADVQAEAAALAARIGAAAGQGPTVLLGLTGRSDMPAGFSVI